VDDDEAAFMASLTPVIEFAPSDYSQREQPDPADAPAANASDWHAHWTASLADSGIHNLEPWRPGSWLVPARNLTSRATLLTLLRQHLADVARSRWTGEIVPIPGGYVLARGEAEILPGCCGDLTNLDSWREAAANDSDAWRMVWIGHPWTFVRRVGDILQFAAPSESKMPHDLVIALSVPAAELAGAIAQAERERRAFASRLLPAIAQLSPPIPAAQLVECLTGVPNAT
jgi:hypothetical protein